MGSTMDLTNSKSLYFLNALDLLSTSGIPYAKSICVDACPSDTCGFDAFPCTNPDAFRCGQKEHVQGIPLVLSLGNFRIYNSGTPTVRPSKGPSG